MWSLGSNGAVSRKMEELDGEQVEQEPGADPGTYLCLQEHAESTAHWARPGSALSEHPPGQRAGWWPHNAALSGAGSPGHQGSPKAHPPPAQDPEEMGTQSQWATDQRGCMKTLII